MCNAKRTRFFLLFLGMGLLIGLLFQGPPKTWAQAPPSAPGKASKEQPHPASSPQPAVSAPAGHKTGFPENVSTPLKVGVAFMVNGVSKINEQTGTFEGTVDLQLRWSDPSLAFDTKEVGTDRQEFGFEAATAKLATIWTPQITIANINDKPIRVEPGLFIYSDGTVVYIQRIRSVFESKYKLAAFPFDTQALTVQLLSNRYSFNQIQFVQEQRDLNASGIREGTSASGWKLKGVEFSPGRIRGWNGNYFPQFDAKIRITREPTNHLMVIFIPLLLIMVVPTVITLYAKADIAPRLTAWSASILALIALNFTLTVRYPALDVDSLVSQMLAIGFGFQTLMVLITVVVVNPQMTDRVSNKFLMPEIVSFLRWSVPLCLADLVLARIFLTALM